MLRLIIDKLGDGHKDLFMKIDNMPSCIRISDSYFILDFLEIDEKEIKNQNITEDSILSFGALKLIDYWIDKIKSIEKGQVKFIPFDLRDEYIGGFDIENTKLGYKVKITSTDKIHGFEVCKSNIDKLVEENKSNFSQDDKFEWLISEQSIFDGLEWSKKEITNAQHMV